MTKPVCRHCGSDRVHYVRKQPDRVQIAYLLAPGEKCPVHSCHEYECDECRRTFNVDHLAD